MTNTEFLIVGQGIAGTMIALELEKAGKSFIILDDAHKHSSSVVAAGTINPVTGRKYVKTWLADTLLPIAKATYSDLSLQLGATIHRNSPIIRSLHSVQEENAWLGRAHDPDYEAYITKNAELGKMKDQIHLAFSYGEIVGSSQVDLPQLLKKCRLKWEEEGKYRQTNFSYTTIDVQSLGFGILYDDIKADNIIFCEGHKVVDNPFFNYLGFEPVKGEALIIHIPDGFEKSIRDKTFITPIGKDHLYWCGAGYEWEYKDHYPTAKAREIIQSQINEVLKVPYEIVDHWAGVRPSTRVRRPYIGKHPKYKNMFVFNGMGTKGSSLAPYFAIQFVSSLIGDVILHPEVDIIKYS